MNTDQFKDNIFKKLQDGFGIALVVLVIYYAITLEIDRSKYTIVFLGLSYALILLKNMGGSKFQYRQKKPSMVIGSFGLISVFLAASAYLYWQYVPLFSERAGAYNSTDVLAAAAIFIPLFFIIWSEGGSALFVLICLFTFYFLYGNLFPGIFEHSGFSIRRTLEETILGFDGVYGVVLLTISTWVSIFLIYAGIIQGFGTLETIVKGCTLIFSRNKILIPQIPVVVSLIFGTFSGAATANVAGTGSFTIKIMKRFGLTPRLAAAIESVASSGGQIMPPLMGATAFLIASFLGVSYLYVVAVGFIPALLFYTALAFSVYLRTARVIDANTVVVEDASFTKQDWLELLPLLLSLLVLFIRLILLVPMMAACIESIEVLIFAQFLHEVLRDRHTKTFWAIAHAFIRSLFTGICRTAPSVASIGIVGACMGLIVRVLTATGLGPKLSAGIVDISGGSLPLLLLLTMLLTLLFGMAVSTIAVYILTTFVVAPVFGDLGIPMIATHFMIFYLGNMSFITPPVAPAALVAAGIAGSRFMSTAWTAFGLGLPLFLLGIAFVYHPELLIWSWQTPLSILIVLVGLLGTATALHLPTNGWGWKPIIERVVALVAACGTMFLGDRTISIVLALLLAAWMVMKVYDIRGGLLTSERLVSSLED